MTDTPFIAVGNDELGDALGETVRCPRCQKQHEVQWATRTLPDGTQVPSRMLAYVKCDDDQAYLVGIAGRSIVR